ncbi:16S rRNA (adenine(1518)-N(6)/adenine(1519)-N(6))-dimethyltransferase RsmA [Candidatus Saccharibacteria bacterium]|nr:16S rRNA (adenine(1518)-N(6)/adenine(1519)-N(6))-dimethyltransferase RsmA [Candidatus Saccharibacteria bacterium]
MIRAKKKLGQHWLKDEATLEAICEAADVVPADIVLEIGPGLGDLTRQLVKRAGQVIAVEIDKILAVSLYDRVQARNLEVINTDILSFDLTSLPANYKVVANIPYYLTSNLIRVLSESTNPPTIAALLVQKEVAERIAAKPGQMSLLSVSIQLYYAPKLGPIVSAELFEPPPKVDSQLVILKRHNQLLFNGIDTKTYFRIVKAGFAGRRKKLRGSLAAGLHLSKADADKLLSRSGINGDQRAQELSLEDWHKLYMAYKSNKM